MLAGRAAAVRAGAQAQKRRHMCAARMAAVDKRIDEEVRVLAILRKYDSNQTGVLEADQLKMLMKDFNDGTEPDDAEVDFMLKVADKSKSDSITKDEVMYAMRVWRTYVDEKQSIDLAFDRFDTDKSGHLDREQLKNFLTELNRGERIDDEEVEWVMSRADILKDGHIHKIELLSAVSAWYAHVEQKESPSAFSACCTIA